MFLDRKFSPPRIFFALSISIVFGIGIGASCLSCVPRSYNESLTSGAKAAKKDPSSKDVSAESASKISAECAAALDRLAAIPRGGELKINSVKDCPLDATAHALMARKEKIEASTRLHDKEPTKLDVAQKSRVVVFFPWSVWEGISKNGFLNQHQTSTSMGTLALDLRLKAEQEMAGVQFRADSAPEIALRNTLLPKYGYLALLLDKSHQDRLFIDGINDTMEQYGKVAAVLKPEVLSRTSWTTTDSLQAYDRWVKTKPKAGDFAFESSAMTFLAPALLKLKMSDSYREAQVWGPVLAKDIEKFLIVPTLGSHESEDIVAKLKSQGFTANLLKGYSIVPNSKEVDSEDEEVTAIGPQ